jgi:hypothetical protein
VLENYFTKTIRGELFGLEKLLSNGGYSDFLSEMSDQIRVFNNGTGHARAVFAIGRTLKGHINNEKRTVFCNSSSFDTHIGPANLAIHFYEFQLQSYRKAVDSWTIIGLRNQVVKDIRKMIGKMVWDARKSSIFGNNRRKQEHGCLRK